MSKPKYYAVRKGRKTGIFETQEEYLESVDGFKGFKAKGFKTLQEAKDYMNKKKAEKPKAQPTPAPKPDDTPRIYVDGCYNPESGVISCAGIITRGGKEVEKFRHQVIGEFWEDARNISGEICGCVRALRRAKKLGYKSVRLYADYNGLKSLAEGRAKPSSPQTEKYVQQIRGILSSGLKVEFVTVKSHSGDKYNELADQMAKKSAGIA